MATIISTKTSGVGGLQVTGDASGILQLASNNGTTAVTVDASQNVGIGQAPNSTTRLEVLSYNGSNGCMMQRVWSNGQYATWFQNASGTNVGNITVNAGGTVYTTTSDYRLKENVQPMVDALSKISQLKPVTYDWIADKTSAQGFIAHELQKVFPDAVTGEKDDVNEDGSIRPQGIDTSALVATLTAAIQELSAIVDTQAERIKALEAK